MLRGMSPASVTVRKRGYRSYDAAGHRLHSVETAVGTATKPENGGAMDPAAEARGKGRYHSGITVPVPRSLFHVSKPGKR